MDYLDIIRQAEETHKQSNPEKSAPSIQAGDSVSWQGADTKQRGPAMVDFLHTDSDGTIWAFVTLPDGWAAVNLKYAKVEGER